MDDQQRNSSLKLRLRNLFTASQLSYLEEKYKKHRYINTRQLWQIASAIDMPENLIKKWFQNRRIEEENLSFISDDEQSDQITTQSTINEMNLSNSIINPLVSDLQPELLPLKNTFDEKDCKEILMIGMKLWTENNRMQAEHSINDKQSDEIKLQNAVDRSSTQIDQDSQRVSPASQNTCDEISVSRNIIEKAMLQSGIILLSNEMNVSANDQQPVSLPSLKMKDEMSDIFEKVKKRWLETQIIKEKQKKYSNDDEQTVKMTQLAVNRLSNVKNASSGNQQPVSLPLITFDDCKEIFMLGIQLWSENEKIKDRKEYGTYDVQGDKLILHGAVNRSNNIMNSSLNDLQLASSSTQNTDGMNENIIETAIPQSGVNYLNNSIYPLAPDQPPISSPSLKSCDEMCDLFEKAKKVWLENPMMNEKSIRIDDKQNIQMTVQSAINRSSNVTSPSVNDQQPVSLPLINTFDESDCKEIFTIGLKLWSKNEMTKKRKECSVDEEQSDEITLSGVLNRLNNIIKSIKDSELISSSSQNTLDEISESRNIIDKAMLRSGINQLGNDMVSSVYDQQTVSLPKHQETFDERCDIFESAKKIWSENRRINEKERCNNVEERRKIMTRQSVSRLDNVISPLATSNNEQNPVLVSLLNTFHRVSNSNNEYLQRAASAPDFRSSRGDNPLKRTSACMEASNQRPTITSDYLTKRKYIPLALHNQFMDKMVPQNFPIPHGVFTNPMQRETETFYDSRYNPVLPTVPPCYPQSIDSAESRSLQHERPVSTITSSRKSASVSNAPNMPSSPNVYNASNMVMVPILSNIRNEPDSPSEVYVPEDMDIKYTRHDMPMHMAPMHNTPRDMAPMDYMPRYMAPLDNTPRDTVHMDNMPRYTVPMNNMSRQMRPMHNMPRQMVPMNNIPRQMEPMYISRHNHSLPVPIVSGVPIMPRVPNVRFTVQNAPSKNVSKHTKSKNNKSKHKSPTAHNVTDILNMPNALNKRIVLNARSIPNATSASNVLRLSNASELRIVTNVPGVPGTSNTPNVSNAPSVPIVSNVTGAPGTPSVSCAPNIRTEPNKPNIPTVPREPSVSNLPNISSAPSPPIASKKPNAHSASSA